MVADIDIGRVISDGLTWETLKYVAKLAIGVIVMTGAGQYLLERVFNRLKKKQEKVAYWIGAPVLICASFLIVSASGNQTSTPNLRGTVEAVYTIQAPIHALVIIETITNSGSMPSIAYSWKAELSRGGNSVDCPTTGFPDQLSIFLPARGSVPERTVTYYSKDSIMVKALLPIPPGGLISGILACELRDINVDNIKENDAVTVSFLDVFQNKHTATIPGSSKYIDIKIFSGITQDVK